MQKEEEGAMNRAPTVRLDARKAGVYGITPGGVAAVATCESAVP